MTARERMYEDNPDTLKFTSGKITKSEKKADVEKIIKIGKPDKIQVS